MTLPRTNEKSNNKGKNDEKSEEATVEYLLKAIEDLQKQNEILKREVLKPKRTPSGKIGFTFLTIGALMLLWSVLKTSTVLAFIGLGLTFWGALFLFVRPVKFVRGTILDSTAISSYTTIDRIIQDLNYEGRPIYIPPYPKEAYLPEYLKNLKEMIVVIPAEDILTVPTVDEMAKKQFLLKNPKGICIAPPGFGLMSLFENELGLDFSSCSLEQLCNNLPAIITELALAEQIEIFMEKGPVHAKVEGSIYKDLYQPDLIHVIIRDSIYKDLFNPERGLKSPHLFGCPLASAIACALSKAAGKLVTTAKNVVSSDLKTIEIWYQTLKA